jgi:hypothetical protein
MRCLFFFLAVLLAGCGKTEPLSSPYQEIAGRDQRPLYRIKAPAAWQRKSVEGRLDDTTIPLCEYQIEGIRITIHNFPNMKIPPQAQIARWQKQFTSISSLGSVITPQAFSGFTGLKFEGSGLIDGKKTAMLGWSLQLAPEFAPFVSGQMGADVTIKVVGPEEKVAAHREDIERFARSFEFIEELAAHR